MQPDTDRTVDLDERSAIAEFDGQQSRAQADRIAADESRALRPYQDSGIAKLREKFRQGLRRCVFYLPTGGGKTEVAAGILAQVLARGKRAAFICHRIELVKQASNRFQRAELWHGIIQGNNSRGEWNSLIVGSIQTIAKRGIDDLDLIIVDEAHACAGTKAYLELFVKFKDKCIVGLTATPFSRGLARHHDVLDGPLFQDIVIGATIPELVTQGFLVDCDIYGPSEPDLSKVKIVAGDYHEGQLAEAVDQPKLIGDIVTHYLRLGGNQQAICFATNIAHSKNIVAQFTAAGIPAAHIDAYTEEAERDRLIGDFKAGKYRILSNVAVLAEGFDAPAVGVMILARPTKSLVRYIQMAGRVLRPFPGKDRAIILDHSGTCRRLGFPTDELPLNLDDGKPKTASGAQEKEKPEPKLCPTCSYLKPAGVHQCPKCGFLPERPCDVEVEAGELQKVKRGKAPPMSQADKARFYQELKFIQQERGYRPGWTMNKYRTKTGVWPAHDFRHLPAAEPSTATQSWVRSQNIQWAKSNTKSDNKAA